MIQRERLNPYLMRPHNLVAAAMLVLSTKTFITGAGTTSWQACRCPFAALRSVRGRPLRYRK